jgi:hypothetical protein
MGPVLGLQGQEARCFLKAFLLSSLTATENTQDHSVLTEDKNLDVCWLFIFRLRLITILVGMLVLDYGLICRNNPKWMNIWPGGTT